MYSKNDEKQNVAHFAKLSDLERVRSDIALALESYSIAIGQLGCMFDGLNLHLSDVSKHTSYYNEGSVEIDKILETVDKRLWDLAISSSGVSAVLSSQGESELRKRYQEKPVAFTAEEANRVIERLAARTPMLAGSTLRSIFEKLTSTNFRRGNDWRSSKENRSHDKIRKSFRFTHFGSFGPNSYYIRDEQFDLFNDLELVCRMVNQCPKLERPNRLGDRMSSVRWKRDVVPPYLFETDHLTVQVFKCGNVKIDFKCDSTLELLNRYGADGKTFIDPFGDEPQGSRSGGVQ
jgi:hypothetical protein